MYIRLNPLVFKNYIITLACESYITIGAQVFENTISVFNTSDAITYMYQVMFEALHGVDSRK